MPDDAGFQTEQKGAVRAWLARRRRRELMLMAGCLGLLVAALAYGVRWQTYSRFQVSTDNAYVRADISVVAAKVTGYVRTLNVTDNQHVAAGDVLVTLDPGDYAAALAQAQANLARAQSELAAMNAQRALAAADLARYRPLAQSGVLSAAGMQQIEARSVQMGASSAALNAAAAAARAEVEAAQLNLERTIIRAPVAGVIGDRQVQLGQLVQPGAPLMAVVPLDAVYVVANFKETQIADVRPGQPVTVRPDIDKSVELHGVVDSIAPASGAEFSIIPMDTATGNFTKIVQRVPIRIRLRAEDVARASLRPGLSTVVTIDTRGAQ
ncbi:MAG: HlyD family secretion protein [Hyphomonadaceae bacterium]